MKLCPQCTSGYHDSHTTCPTHGGVLSEIRDLRPGMLIHKTYRIVRKLGRGGMGTVYLADHVFMQEQRALKFLAPELCEDAEFTERFRREVWTLKKIRHDNVIHCGDLEPAEDDSLFFAMEYVDGPDMREFLRGSPGPIELKTALAITRGIAEGLGAAHALGMVHRDIKPENILMARPGDQWLPKIADFGIVATRESTGNRTRTGGTLLTMQYAAPEQWRGTRSTELDGRTDFYALGGVLYELLTGRTPFQAESYEEWADKHKNAQPNAPSQMRPELAKWPGLDLLLWRMLAKDRSNRPANAAELTGSIDEILSGKQTAFSPRYPAVVEPPPFRPFPDVPVPTQPRVNPAGPAGQSSAVNPVPNPMPDPRRDSGGHSVPPPFGANPADSRRPGVPPPFDPSQGAASQPTAVSHPGRNVPPLAGGAQEATRPQPLATYLVSHLGVSGRLAFSTLLGLHSILQVVNGIRVENELNALTNSIVAAGCALCCVALVLRWRGSSAVKWLGPAGWFSIALLKVFSSISSLVFLSSRYGVSEALVRYGSAWLGSLCLAGAATYFGLSEAGQGAKMRSGAAVSRICFLVLLLLLGVLDILRMLPYSGYMAAGPRAIFSLLGVVEVALAAMLLASFRTRMTAITLAAAYVVMAPLELAGNLQALRLMPILAATLPTFVLAMAGGVLALAELPSEGSPLDTQRHAP